MRIFSLLAHPRPNSFCHAISERARQALSMAGHAISHHDLYAEGFDPCLTAEEAYSIGDTLEVALSRADDPVLHSHRTEIAHADGLLIVHPNWWGKPPAILAGWCSWRSRGRPGAGGTAPGRPGRAGDGPAGTGWARR